MFRRERVGQNYFGYKNTWIFQKPGRNDFSYDNRRRILRNCFPDFRLRETAMGRHISIFLIETVPASPVHNRHRNPELIELEIFMERQILITVCLFNSLRLLQLDIKCTRSYLLRLIESSSSAGKPTHTHFNV